MNMNHAPMQDQLRQLFDGFNDLTNGYILWADGLGEVHITLLSTETTSDWIKRMGARIQFQCAAYPKNSDELGKVAADDSIYVAMLFTKLMTGWQNNKV